MIRTSIEGKREDGAIVIEASIMLPMFLFIFLTFYSVVNICFWEAKVQNALNNAAKEISTYSYIYSFTGLKQKADGLYEAADSTREEINENVVGNIGSFVEGVEGVIGGSGNVVNSAKDGLGNANSVRDLKDIVSDVKAEAEGIKAGANQAMNSGKELLAYFKDKFSDPKAFALELLKLLSSDGISVAKNLLGEVLAKNLSRSYFNTPKEVSFWEGIDFGKSQLFPGTTNDIIFVAEYKVRITPYIPIDISYTISQKAQTRGWLDGDGGHVERNKVDVPAIHTVKQDNSDWIVLSPTERAKKFREEKKAELNKVGYRNSSKNNNIVYNPQTNTMAIIATSNPMYEKKSLDEMNDEEIKDMLLRNATAVSDIDSSIEYKEKTSNGGFEKKTAYPYDLAKNEGMEIKKEFYLIVPEDEGIKERIQQVWDNMTDKEKDGVELKISQEHGRNNKA